MKTLTVLFSILLISIQSFAQETQDKQFYQNQLKNAKSMKSGGIVLTAIGGVLCIAGLHKMTNSLELFASEQNSDYKTGETITVVGTVFVGGGIPLLIVGARNQRKYNRTLQTLSVGVNASAQNKGLTFTYKF